MNSTRFLLLGVSFVCTLSVLMAAPKDPAPDEPANDPLPPGAKVRYGVTRPILRTNPTVALVPPTYTNFLAPTEGSSVRRYDLGTGKPLLKAANEQLLIAAGHVTVSADGKRAAVSQSAKITVVDANSGKKLLDVVPPEGVVLSGTVPASLSGDGTLLAYGARSKDGKGEVIVIDVDTQAVAARFETIHEPPVYTKLSRDGKSLVTYGLPKVLLNVAGPAGPRVVPAALSTDQLRMAQVWDVLNIKELFQARVTGMENAVVGVAFSPNGEQVAMSCGDGPVDVWEVKTGKRLHTLLGRKGQGVCVAFSPDGRRIASVGSDFRIQMWTSEGTSLGVTDPPPPLLFNPVTGLEFVDNDRAIAWMTAEKFIVAWEAPTGRLVSPFTEHFAPIRSIAFPDGAKSAFTSGADGKVNRWDFPTGTLGESIPLKPAILPGQPLLLPVVRVTADGTRASGYKSPSEVFDLATGQHLFVVPPPSAPPAPHRVHFSHDGLRLVTQCLPGPRQRSGTCVVWDIVTPRRIAEIEVPLTRSFPLVDFSPSGNRLVLGCVISKPLEKRQMLRVIGWDLKEGKKLGEVEDADAIGEFMMSAVSESTAIFSGMNGKLWSVDFEAGKLGSEYDQLPVRNERAVRSPVVVSPDGKRFATGVVGDELETYGVRVYDFPSGKRTHTFQGHLGPITSLRFTPDGNAIATGSEDSSVILWDLTKPAEK